MGSTTSTTATTNPPGGIFLTVDPLLDTTGQPYLYAGGNPTSTSDPSGLDPCGRGLSRTACSAVSGIDNKPPSCGGGYVQTGCLPTLLPDRYRQFVGSGDGRKDQKVVYFTRKIEPGERDLCAADRVACLAEANDLSTIKNLAEESRVNTDRGDGTLGNGRRHALLAALLTWQLGEDRARIVLEAHENIRNGRLLTGQEFDEFRMTDLINNEIGIALGKQLSDEWGHAHPETSYFVGDDYGVVIDASGFYTAEGLAAVEDAVLSDPNIVYFQIAG